MALARSKKHKYALLMQNGFKHLSVADLEIFVAVVEEGSLAAVARSLDVTPSMISKVIKKIENLCGFKILQRSAMGVQLHAEAHFLLEYAKDVSAAATSLSFKKASPSVENKLISIATPSYLQSHLVAVVRADLERAFPEIRFQLIEAGAEQIIKLSVAQNFDIALSSGKLNLTKTYHSEMIGWLNWGLYARNQHPISRNIDVTDLKSARFIVPFGLEKKGWKLGDDKGYPPIHTRLAHDMVQTAAVGIQLALETDQLIYVPEIIARPQVKAGTMKMIHVKGRTTHKEELYIHAHQDRVDQFFLSKLAHILSRVLN